MSSEDQLRRDARWLEFQMACSYGRFDAGCCTGRRKSLWRAISGGMASGRPRWQDADVGVTLHQAANWKLK